MILRLFSLIALSLAFAPNFGLAQAKSKTELKSSDSVRALQEISKKYRSTNLVRIETNKKVTSELMGRTTEYVGIMHLSKGKFRWENETPEKSLLLFDGKTIWNVQYPPADLGGPVQVAIAKLNKNTKSQILISTLIGKDPIEKNFEVVSEKKEQDIVIIELKPLSSDLRVKELTLELEPSTKWILKISFKDDVNNLTVIEMKKTEFIKKENKKLFKYEIPKDAQVTNL